MSRYEAMFERLSTRREGAFGAFLMLGDPDLATSARNLDALVAGGADMIEVGVPFSDPIADGSVIQAAAIRALSAGVRTADAFGLIAGFRDRHPDVPVGVLTYANLVLARGRDAFLGSLREAGVDSLLVADVPVLEAPPWVSAARDAGIAPVLIATANASPERLREIAAMSEGYTYCVSRAGITGTHATGEFDDRLVLALADANAAPPVFGFGISAPEHVTAALRTGAAGVISGSAIVACASRGGDIAALVARLKAATRNDFPPK